MTYFNPNCRSHDENPPTSYMSQTHKTQTCVWSAAHLEITSCASLSLLIPPISILHLLTSVTHFCCPSLRLAFESFRIIAMPSSAGCSSGPGCSLHTLHALTTLGSVCSHTRRHLHTPTCCSFKLKAVAVTNHESAASYRHFMPLNPKK